MPDRTTPTPTGSESDGASSTRPPMLTWRRLLILVGVAIALTALVFFVADNFVLVQIRVFTLRIQARLAWALIVPLVLVLGLGWVAHAMWLRLRRRARDG